MQASSSVQDVGGEYSRMRHASVLSITDPEYHVTEAIGDLYGDHDGRRDSHLSMSASPPRAPSDGTKRPYLDTDIDRTSPHNNSLLRAISTDKLSPVTNGNANMDSSGIDLSTSPRSPTFSIHDRSPTEASSQYPLTDIDYESSPAAVAQELSNLQALRRMSMDANAVGDPDLPSFDTFMPTISPSASDDEDDPSRLFWVPARLHPELAPESFKSFIESKKEAIRRRSGEFSLSPDDASNKQSPGSGLRRKKSMLSRQIDKSRAAESYTDGSERLERKRSRSGSGSQPTITDLQELEELVKDPAGMVRKMSMESAQSARASSGGEVPASEDMPILPAAPPGTGLRRSKHTTYRKGSLRRGGVSRRQPRVGTPEDDAPPVPALPTADKITAGLTQARTEPNLSHDKLIDDAEKPARHRAGSGPVTLTDEIVTPPSSTNNQQQQQQPSSQLPPSQNHVHQNKQAQNSPNESNRSAPQPSKQARPQTPVPPSPTEVPKIIQTPPPAEQAKERPKEQGRSSSLSSIPKSKLPERTSSHDRQQSLPTHQNKNMHDQSGRRPSMMRQTASSHTPAQTLENIVAHPSPLPGNTTRTDSLSFIPTIAEDKEKSSKKGKKDRDGDGGRKSSWSALLFGGDDKEKRRDKDEEYSSKKKSKLSKERNHDNARLDLLQNSIEGRKSRESLVLDRGEVKLDEERKKENSRKFGNDSKKDKESGFFSFLGGGKKKSEKELSKKHMPRTLSPEPPPRILVPDVDYNWTRFSLLEERAIYRMAHLKLANPRRPLHSQVLLSNFMYSYLAKVQAMHPQMNIPTQPGSKQSQQRQQSQQRKNESTPEEYLQYQRYQEQQQQQQQQQQLQSQQYQDNDYGDDLYDYEDEEPEENTRPHSRASQHSSRGSKKGRSGDGSGGASNGYSYGDQSVFEDSQEDGDMW